jgi:hypothetical protein
MLMVVLVMCSYATRARLQGTMRRAETFYITPFWQPQTTYNKVVLMLGVHKETTKDREKKSRK